MLKKILILLIIIIAGLTIYTNLKTPSNDRDWAFENKLLPYSEIKNSQITIHNIRNITYRATDDFDINYYDKTFNLDKIKSVDFMVEPFSDWRGPAHTLLSFGFENTEFTESDKKTKQDSPIDYVAISVELRKEKDESFSPWKGLLNEYELTYVIADEKDVIKLRTNYRKDTVFLYPIKAPKEKMQKLFLDMLNRANNLKENPEFYNTLTSTCTTNIVDHVNKIIDHPINPFNYKILLPGYSDELALTHGFIDTTLSLEEARKKFQINDLAEKYANSPDFSVKIRSAR